MAALVYSELKSSLSFLFLAGLIKVLVFFTGHFSCCLKISSSLLTKQFLISTDHSNLLNFFKLFTGNVSWPTGKYGLPMPKAGCPNNWFDGRRFHDDNNSNLIDRKLYDSLHLAGWVSKEGISMLFLSFKRLHTMTTVYH